MSHLHGSHSHSGEGDAATSTTAGTSTTGEGFDEPKLSTAARARTIRKGKTDFILNLSVPVLF